MPELDRLFGVPQPEQHHPEIDAGAHVMRAIECAAQRDEPLDVRFALLVHDLGKGTTPPELWPAHLGHEARSLPLIEGMCERLRVPVSCRELALAVARWLAAHPKVSWVSYPGLEDHPTKSNADAFLSNGHGPASS